MASDLPDDELPPESAPRRLSPGWSGRLAVAGRVALAAFGGYGVAALATALGAVALPLPRAEAVSAATQASFAVMAGAVVFVFAASSLGRAAAMLGGIAAFLTAGLWFAGAFAPTVPA